MRILSAVIALVVVAIVAPIVLVFFEERPAGAEASGLPWQIELTADGGSRVFGLQIGESVLDDARAVFGEEMELAIVAAPAQAGSLEAYFDSVKAGFVTGKLILTADIPAEQLAAMRERAAKVEYMESTTRKHSLARDDLAQARAARIRAIAFIPSVNLDEAILLQRFGEPAQRVRASEHLEHFLYPAKGLHVALDAKGKELLQYVAPRDFALLGDPLVAAAQAR